MDEDNREMPIPLIDMQVYNFGFAPKIRKPTLTPEEARRITYGVENYIPDMLNGTRQVDEVLKRQKKEDDSDGILEIYHAERKDDVII